MKKIHLMLLTLILAMATQSVKADDQASASGTVVLYNEIFSVSGPSPRFPGVERDFTLDKKSKVTVALASNKSKPSLNVRLLDAENYSKYQASGSFTNLNVVDSLSKTGTLGFNESTVLPPGKYAFIIHWGETGLFISAPAVAFKLMIHSLEDAAPKPTSTPVKKWYQF